MTDYTLESGETETIAPAQSPGRNYFIEVSGANIRASTSRQYVEEGTLIPSNTRGKIAVPSGEEINVYNAGNAAAELEVSRMSTNQLTGSNLRIDYAPTSDVSISGDIDVSDRENRVLGDVTLSEYTGGDIPVSGGWVTPDDFPLSVDTGLTPLSPGDLPLSVDTGLTPLSPDDLPLTVTEETNPSGVYTDTLTGDGSFGPKSVPAGLEVSYIADSGNSGPVLLDGSAPIPAGGSIELAVSDVSDPNFTSSNWGTLYAVVEV